jgi:starch-binding outer membrane protein, SusD/RagB family
MKSIMISRLDTTLLLLRLCVLCCVGQFSTGCTAFVQNVERNPYGITDESNNVERRVPALIVGVRVNFDQSYGSLSLYASMLSDELYTSFTQSLTGQNVLNELDNGTPALREGNAPSEFSKVAKVRILADTLLARVPKISFGTPAVSQRLRDEMLYTGHFYGAVSRYLMATYFGLRQREGGGGVINRSAFIPAAELYQTALAKLDSAKRYTTDDSTKRRQIETFMARIYLFLGQYDNAEQAAGRGLSFSDKPLEAIFLTEIRTYDFGNPWINYNFVKIDTVAFADRRFLAYAAQDSLEARRVPVRSVVLRGTGGLQYTQARYTRRDSPIPFLTWQENELMLAECNIRRGAAASGLENINRVRAFYGIKPLQTATLETIIVERDKELFCTGMRLPDQRRFNRWHLGAGTWQYLPIPQSERDLNPNLAP